VQDIVHLPDELVVRGYPGVEAAGKGAEHPRRHERRAARDVREQDAHPLLDGVGGATARGHDSFRLIGRIGRVAAKREAPRATHASRGSTQHPGLTRARQTYRESHLSSPDHSRRPEVLSHLSSEIRFGLHCEEDCDKLLEGGGAHFGARRASFGTSSRVPISGSRRHVQRAEER
jgi:hypothetical protein